MDEPKDIFYLYLHSKIGEPVINKDKLMSISEVEFRMAQWRIPERLRIVIIKIWERMGIVTKVDNRTIEFNKTNFDIEDMREIYQSLNLF